MNKSAWPGHQHHALRRSGVRGARFFGAEWAEIAATLQHYRPWTFVAACGLAFLNYVIRFVRWEYYLRVLRMKGSRKRRELSHLPFRFRPDSDAGQSWRSLQVAHSVSASGRSHSRTAPIVVAERVTDLIGVILLITIGSVTFEGGLVWAGIGLSVVVLLLVLVASPTLCRTALDILPRLPLGLGRAAARVVPKVEEALDRLRDLTTPSRLLLPTVLAVVSWGCEGLALWVILGGFGDPPPAVPFTVFVYSTATLAGALIPVPGGLGVTDGLIKEQLARLGGVPEGTATASMLLVRFATLWFAVAVGFVALAILRAIRPALTADDRLNAARQTVLRDSAEA